MMIYYYPDEEEYHLPEPHVLIKKTVCGIMDGDLDKRLKEGVREIVDKVWGKVPCEECYEEKQF